MGDGDGRRRDTYNSRKWGLAAMVEMVMEIIVHAMEMAMMMVDGHVKTCTCIQ